jgi:hypothetical protein
MQLLWRHIGALELAHFFLAASGQKARNVLGHAMMCCSPFLLFYAC